MNAELLFTRFPRLYTPSGYSCDLSLGGTVAGRCVACRNGNGVSMNVTSWRDPRSRVRRAAGAVRTTSTQPRH
eukprot:4747900-Prymnesium_polylepis.1